MKISKVICFVSMLMTVSVLLALNSSALGDQKYDLQIIAQTGVAIGNGTPIALGQGPSLNDAGKVAFIARNTDANHGRVMSLNNGVVEQDCFIGTLASVSSEVQINDNHQVIFRQRSDDGLFSDVVRLDGPCSGQIIGRGSQTSQFPEPFDVVLPAPTLNDTGRGIFSGNIGSTTYLGSRLNGSGSYSISPALAGFHNLYPLLADDDTTVVRWGKNVTDPLLLLTDANLNAAYFIAESDQFNAIGEQPGISDDGNVVAFVADHKTTGFGIYVSLFTGADFTPIKMIGIGGDFSNFSLAPRVGVNRTIFNSTQAYTLAYIGFDASSNMGLYVTAIDITNPLAPTILGTLRVVAVGDRINGLKGYVNNIKIHDPINNNGQLVFWVSTDEGEQAIVRASQSTMDAFDPGCEFPPNLCRGEFLKENNNRVVVDQTKLNSILNSSIKRSGAVADGVTTLLLRVKTNEMVTFTLKNPAGQAADSKWGVLSNMNWTSEGNTITVSPISTAQGSAAFAVYHAPGDLPCSYDANGCDIGEIAGNQQVIISASSATQSWQKRVSLLPPPLVFVHGVWSDSTAWFWMSRYLEQNGFSVCSGCLVDYGTKSPAAAFDPLDPAPYAIKSTIKSTELALRKVRAENIAATQVDMIGHSEGGLVARAMTVFNDSQDQYKAIKNYNQGSIHKIITVGTPHLGTQIADFLVRNKCNKLISIGPMLENVFEDMNKPIGPAIFGFQTASPALPHVGLTEVPSHAIVGLAPDFSLTEEKLNVVIRAFVSPLENVDHILTLNGNGHDTIVPQESQEGGLNPLAVSTPITNIVHADLTVEFSDAGETGSQAVWDEVKRLLLVFRYLNFNTVPQATGEGTPTFPVNPYLTPAETACPASFQSSNMSESDASVLLLPASGTIVAPGDTVDVYFSVTGGNPVDGALFVVGNGLEGMEASGPFTFSFTVPQNVIGDMDISAYTFGPGPENYTASTTITVEPVQAFTQISATPDFLPLGDIDQSFQITVNGDYTDGTIVNLTKAGTGTVYSTQSGTTSVISVSANGLVQATGVGEETVLITNRGLSTSVPVKVEIVNHAPVLNQIGNQTITEGQLLVLNISATDTDSDAIFLSARLASGDPVSSIGASFADHGNGTGSFSWTANLSHGNVVPVVFQAVDAHSLMDSEMITITINSLPEIAMISPPAGSITSAVTIAGEKFGSLTATPNWSPYADFNRDGLVNISDLLILATNWQVQSGATHATGDANGDGKVDAADLGVLAVAWQAIRGSSYVQFSNGIDAKCSNWTDTSITCEVPYEAVTGPVVVKTSVGTSNGVNFTIGSALSGPASRPVVRRTPYRVTN